MLGEIIGLLVAFLHRLSLSRSRHLGGNNEGMYEFARYVIFRIDTTIATSVS